MVARLIFARSCHAGADVMADLSVDPITGQSDPRLHEEVTSSNAGRPWPHAVSKGPTQGVVTTHKPDQDHLGLSAIRIYLS